ncbi:MAG: hypothetical protein M2R45_00314 [Verrucomicrobia subdivision 3 bacterium]|nr:hypothetical protein [Limisphaerales bacterium]MCS1412927.1 hypothetical protein [Limisphaerales bacterium]
MARLRAGLRRKIPTRLGFTSSYKNKHSARQQKNTANKKISQGRAAKLPKCGQKRTHSLGDVAKISSGVTFRSRIEQVAQGTTRLIRLKDITGNDELIRELDFRIHNRFKPHHLLSKGDIIFRPLAPHD